jgi:hypothetical protein
MANSVSAILEQADAAIARGPTLDDLPVLALAAGRRDECWRGWAIAWESIGPRLPPDGALAGEILAVAGELMVAERERVGAQRAQRDEDVLQQLMREAAKAAGRLGELDSTALRARAEYKEAQQRADRVRIATGRIAELETRLKDLLRVSWKNGR